MNSKLLSRKTLLGLLGLAVLTQYDSIAGAPVAVNTAVAALVKGASTALTHAFRTPTGSTGYDRVRGSASSDGAVVGAAVFMADIKNTGSLQQTYVMSAIGGQLATGGAVQSPISEYIVNVPIAAGTDLDVDVYMNGTDTGSAVVILELRFTDLVDPKSAPTVAYSRMGQATSINAGVAMQTALNSTGAGDVSVPKNYKRLTQVGVIGASTTSVVGQCAGQVSIAIPGAPIVQFLAASPSGGTLNTTANQTPPQVDVRDYSYPLAENQALPAQVFFLVTDTGAYSAGVTFVMSQNA